MDKKWEIRRISTSERIFNKIKEEMAQPVGIVLFGADCDFKNEILDTIAKGLRGSASYYTIKAPSTDTLIWAFSRHSVAIVALNSDEFSMHSLRHELVKGMRNAGAETVIGIYAKVRENPVPIGKAMVSAARDKQINKQIAAIEQSNPSADGLDYFIVVEEEKEG